MIKFTHTLPFTEENTMSEIKEFSYTAEALKKIAKRPERSNKYTFGRVLFICGTQGMAGASYLAALAAYRTGAGLCELYIPEENRIILQTLLPEAIVKTYSGKNIDTLSELIKKSDSIVVGCGLGKSELSLELVKKVLRESEVPTVVDADALNLISEHPCLMKYLNNKIATPHFAEMARLSGKDISEISERTRRTALEFAKKNGCICVLKDRDTIVSDGESVYLNNSGNSGLAKAGSGDLLAGIIGALLARRDAPLSSFDAATLGVYIHGLAGDVAKERHGEFSMLATDTANAISEVLKNIK